MMNKRNTIIVIFGFVWGTLINLVFSMYPFSIRWWVFVGIGCLVLYLADTIHRQLFEGDKNV